MERETRRRLARFALPIALLGASAAGGRASAAGEDAVGAARVVAEAFARRYACAITGVVEISTSKGDMHALKRRLHIAAKFMKGRLHTYAVFREPQYVRGMTFLGVESDDPQVSEQQFVYLPSMKKIRRVSGSQPAPTSATTTSSASSRSAIGRSACAKRRSRANACCAFSWSRPSTRPTPSSST
jgi:hypothetical protein